MDNTIDPPNLVGDVHPFVVIEVTDNADSGSCEFTNFKVNSGTLVAGTSDPYRSAGVFKSRTFAMPADGNLTEAGISVSTCSATNYIDKVEIVNAATDVVITRDRTNITHPGSYILTGWNVPLTEVNVDFYYKVTFAGNGQGPCVMNLMYLYYEYYV
jgi:hypothetical protein